jgi:hypothetical protein
MDPKVQRRSLFVVPWVVECGSLASAHRIVQPNESKKLDRAEPLLRSIEETPGAQRKMFKLFRQSLAPCPTTLFKVVRFSNHVSARGIVVFRPARHRKISKT